MKTVYAGMAADIVQYGHIYFLNEISKYGKVIIGLLTDEAISSYKRVPISTWEQRKSVLDSLKMIDKVVPQNTLDYTNNLRKYKPDYVAHTSDWKYDAQKPIRDKVVEVIKEWNGQLIEIDRLDEVSSTKIMKYNRKMGISPDIRKNMLRKLIQYKPIVRVLESHNGLSASIVENMRINADSEYREFDAIWISSLTDSASKGKPDIEIVDFTSRLETINEVLEVSTKPIIVDVDTGGHPEQLRYLVKTLDRLGVSAIIIEDKRYPKQNSLLSNAQHIQEDIDRFCEKLRIGIQSRLSTDFMIIARIESLIAGKSVQDALLRANAYIESGVDAIMIHSKDKEPTNLIEFCNRYTQLDTKVPLVLVPTAYSQYTEDELRELGCNIVIYANHLLRSSCKAMIDTARTILSNKRAYDVEDRCMNVKDVINIEESDSWMNQ